MDHFPFSAIFNAFYYSTSQARGNPLLIRSVDFSNQHEKPQKIQIRGLAMFFRLTCSRLHIGT
jgi:hypothetical protein